LFKLGSADNEEEFRHFASLAEQKIQLQSRLNLLTVQLEHSSIKQNELPAYFEKNITRYYLDALEQSRIELKKNETKCLEKQSDLKHQVRQLEEGGIYEEKMQQFYEMRATFNEEAKEWAKYALAKELLNKTIHTFKTERLPQVLAKAEEYFSYLTDEDYTKIIIKKDEDGFFVQQKGKLLFHVNEISRGTAEQLYVSLRLALADTTFSDDPFPLIIDDSFVNFDKKRTRNIMNLLQRISEHRQIIFFTCHEHLLSYFSKVHVNEWTKPERNKSSESLTLL
jgi:uncharacterized protein YhaN